MRTQQKNLAQSQNLIQTCIELPQKMLIEQINLIVVQPNSKKQSEFSKNFQLISVIGEQSEACLKSAYSECTTQIGKIEYNITAVSQKVTLIFAKETNPVINTSEIQISVNQQAADIDLEDRVLAGYATHGITTDDDDDIRILDSLPSNRINSNENQGNQSSLNKLLLQIEVVGFNMMAVPAITNLTYFMNQHIFLQGKLRDNEADQIELLTCQLLVTTKRSTQAAEMYRKIQIKTLSNKNTNTFQKNKQFIECAVYELLVADSLSPVLQLKEKILSLQRLRCFLKGEQPKDISNRFATSTGVIKTDLFTSMLECIPECLRFSIACLTHKFEIVRICALKMLKFILETLGCSLDYAMVFILQAIIKIYPQIEGQQHSRQQVEDFDLKSILEVDISIIEYFFKLKRPQNKVTEIEKTKYTSIEEPQSGSKRAILNIYNSLLDTYISVLSSVSSHILHAIFYEVIEPTLNATFQQQNGQLPPIEVRVFTCKIADKIFTICQGDLILTPRLLDTILQLTQKQKAQLPDSIENVAQSQVKNLWVSIKQKVLPNYSNRGYFELINWLVSKLTQIQGVEGVEENIRTMAELITIIALGRQKNEEEANQLIQLPSQEKYGGGASNELYLVLAPLLYWLEFSIDKEDRFSLFMQVYQSIKDVLASLHKSQCNLEIVSIILPSLQRVSDFMSIGNSPNLSMLKFLDVVLTDVLRYYQKIQRPPTDIQIFFGELLGNFVSKISYSIYEEVLTIFDKLVALSSDMLTSKVLQLCIISLVDKYTQKSKQLKQTTDNFMKLILSQSSIKNQTEKHQISKSQAIEEMLSEGQSHLQLSSRINYFEIMADFCFFSNHGRNITQDQLQQLEFRSPQDIYDLNIEKLQFFIDCLALMNEQHISVFTSLITHQNFRANLMGLLDSGESQSLLPVPTFANELMKSKRNEKKNKKNYDSQDDSNTFEANDETTLDIELLNICETTPELDVMDPAYLRMRMKLVFSFWPHVQVALNSPWSNIRSICYGLICSMLRIDLNDYPNLEPGSSYDEQDQVHYVSQNGLQNIVLPMLYSLLNSKESESKAGGLNILGSFCGLSYDFTQVKVHKYLGFFKRNSSFVSYKVWQLVWSLQEDWDITIKEASVVLIQLCAPRNAVNYFENTKETKEFSKLEYLLKMNKVADAYLPGVYSVGQEQQVFDKLSIKSQHANRTVALFPTQQDCEIVLSLTQNKEEENKIKMITFNEFMMSRKTYFPQEITQSFQILKMSDELAEKIFDFDPDYNENDGNINHMLLIGNKSSKIIDEQSEFELFFVDSYSDDQIQEIISIFRNDFKPPKNLWIEKLNSHNQPKYNSQHQGQQHPISTSPDFFQEIYSEAIEQFNQHQIMMQQKQQDELQLQVTTGGYSSSNNTSQSSISSSDSQAKIVNENVSIDQKGFQENMLNKSYDSSTSTPSPLAMTKEISNETPPKKQIPELVASQIIPPNHAGIWPTSPVLVSSGKNLLQKNVNSNLSPNITQDSNQHDTTSSTLKDKKKSLQMEQLDFESMKVLGKVNSQGKEARNQTKIKLSPVSNLASFENANDEEKQKKKQESDLKSQGSPKFRQYSMQIQKDQQIQNQNNSSVGILLQTSDSSGEQKKISRKTAQTYLQSLNQGYIQKIDKLKLINTCLSQQQMPQTQNLQPIEFLNLQLNNSKKFSNLATQGTNDNVVLNKDSMNTNSELSKTKNNKIKKQILSNSPQTNQVQNSDQVNINGYRKSSRANTKKISHPNNNLKIKQQLNNLADLNYFMKSLEKGIGSVNTQSIQTTPSNVIKRVENQMRSLGVDPNVWRQVEQQENRKSGETKQIHPKMKLLALNQIIKSEGTENLTPTSINNLGHKNLNRKASSSRKKIAGKSNDSDPEFRKNQKVLKQSSVTENKISRDSESRDNLNSGRGRGGQSSNRNSLNFLNQPAILNTERNSQNDGTILQGFKSQVIGKHSNSTRYDSTGLFSFGKNNVAKQKASGYSTLAYKSAMSPPQKKLNDHQLSHSGITAENEVSLNKGSSQKIQIYGTNNQKKKKLISKGNIQLQVGQKLQFDQKPSVTSNHSVKQYQSNRKSEKGAIIVDQQRRYFSPDIQTNNSKNLVISPHQKPKKKTKNMDEFFNLSDEQYLDE